MPAFLAGLGAIYAATLTATLAAESDWLDAGGSAGILALTLILIPVASAWIAAELAVASRRPRLFDPRLRRTRPRLFLGLITGALSLGVGAALLPVLDLYAADTVILGSTAAVITFGVTIRLPRHLPGHCIFCGYDLRSMPAPGHPGAGLCPECGRPATA
jgi:hypothetical protein